MQEKVVDKFKLKDTREIVFRYPKIGDAGAMLDYINTLSKEKTFIRFQGEQLTLDFEIKRLTDLLKKIENKLAVQVLVFCNSKIVGISDLIMHEGATKHTGGFGITLAKEFRNKGIGKKLMTAVINEAIKNIKEIKIIFLSCFSDNTVALNLYKSMGFVEFGKLPEGIMHQDHFDDHIYMFKKVTSANESS